MHLLSWLVLFYEEKHKLVPYPPPPILGPIENLCHKLKEHLRKMQAIYIGQRLYIPNVIELNGDAIGYLPIMTKIVYNYL